MFEPDSVLLTIILDILAWLLIHLGLAYASTHISLTHFNPRNRLFHKRVFEREGQLYEVVFKIRQWKQKLPDGGAWFQKGFSKKRLKSFDSEYLNAFIKETCRAELVHLLVIVAAPLFFLWNRWWVGCIMIAYALLANLPCILAQRYNRIYLENFVTRHQRR